MIFIVRVTENKTNRAADMESSFWIKEIFLQKLKIIKTG